MRLNKTILILGLILVGMVAFIWFRSQEDTSSPDLEAYTQAVGDIATEDINEVRLATSGASLSLVPENGEWKVNEFAADSQEVATFLNRLLQPENVELISENQEKHADLGVAEDDTTAVVLVTANKEVKMNLGETSQGGRYVRLDGEVKVYLVPDVPLGSDLNQASAWIDPVIIRAPQDSISRLQVNEDGSSVVLVQQEGEWVQEGNEPELLDPTGFMSMLDTLSEFYSEDMVEEDVSGLSPIRTVIVSVGSTEPVELNFYSSEDEEYVLVTSSAKPGVFRVFETTADNFVVNEVDLRAKNAT